MCASRSLLFFPRARRAFESDLAPCSGFVKKEEREGEGEGREAREGRIETRVESERVVRTRPSCRCTFGRWEEEEQEEEKREREGQSACTPGAYDIPGVPETTREEIKETAERGVVSF